MIQGNPMKQMGTSYVTKSFTDHGKAAYSGVEHKGALATRAVLWDRT